MRITPLLFALSLIQVAAVQARQLEGPATVIDADTIEVGGERVRLQGIDAPEPDQPCERDGRTWACGRAATAALRAWLDGDRVRCEGAERDRYGRFLARCRVRDEDLGRWLVRSGWALAYRRYSRDYVADEVHAARSRAGLWAGEFVQPWAWRHGERSQRASSPAPPDAAAPSADCRIKGNVSRAGKIYHVPGSASYAATKIDPARGERWFCSEREAIAAGWRAPRGSRK